MDAATLQQGGNELLAILPLPTLSRMAAHCSSLTLKRGDPISEPDQPIAAAIFIEAGVASLFKSDNVGNTEIALTGPEGFCGTPLVLEDESWPYRVIVQSDEFTGLQIEAAAFRALIAEDRDLRRVLLRSVQVRMIQISEGLISNARQTLVQRLARWLLMYRDRTRSDRLAVTHEYMATMVGVQRTGITAALHELEGDGLISARRGLVTILSVPALIALAAGGYGLPEKQQARLFHARPATPATAREATGELAKSLKA
jgi:CRP-like cAMP-binding protein